MIASALVEELGFFVFFYLAWLLSYLVLLYMQMYWHANVIIEQNNLLIVVEDAGLKGTGAQASPSTCLIARIVSGVSGDLLRTCSDLL